MTRVIVVTGVNGFVGPHVVESLKSKGYSVVGLGRDRSPASGLAVDDYVSADLGSGANFRLPEYDGIIHLAGLSAVGPSFDEPRRYLDMNGGGFLSLMEEHIRVAPSKRILVVSTGAVYADKPGALLSESDEIGFSSPYVVSKLLVENLARYFRLRGVDAIVARPFNHIGPGQHKGFIVPDLVESLSRTPAGSELAVGDLRSSRDYTDVRDVAQAYSLLVAAPYLRFDTYNVCSGRSVSGIEMLESLCAVLGRSVPNTKVDEGKVRPVDGSVITGDSSRLTADTGWVPTLQLKHTLRDFVEADRVGQA